MTAISQATRRKCLISRASRKEGYGPTARYTEPTRHLNGQPHTRWQAEDVIALMDMRDRRGMEWKAIAEALGRTEAQCVARWHYGRPHHNASYVVASHKCSDEQLAEREARKAGYDARDLNSQFFGDPPLGFSALDRRELEKPRTPSLPNISAMTLRGHNRWDAR